ncbi:zinc ribbon domain-containing protein [Sphingobium sufflavum]|uniref:zinc ribbon domain-containing protein n=1 Tax=Sphingobium sufflavum TaxID=1129547 RepID=UPI003899DD53
MAAWKRQAVGRYSYYVCNEKATAGAESCSSRQIRRDALDRIVLDGLLQRVLAPSRLRLLLAGNASPPRRVSAASSNSSRKAS